MPAATRTCSPTLSAKYCCVRAETSAAFSWNAYGVASTIACGLASPSRDTSSRCTVTIVGLVSPDPMIASTVP